MISLLLLAASLVVLTVGAELLVRGATGLAVRLGVSSFFIGLTIVGFGTSTPELATGVTAALAELPELNVGNVVGSNIFNIAVILGLSALICPIPVRTQVVRSEGWIVIAVAFVPYVSLLSGRTLARPIALVLVAALVAYVIRGYLSGRREAAAGPLPGAAAERRRPAVLDVVLVLAGLALLVMGSRLLVHASTALARQLGISELVIALTIVAGGTSAPELVTSLVGALRRQADIAVGNILGSNIFNLLGILGATSLISPQTVGAQVLVLDAPVMVLAHLAVLPIMTSQARISRGEGVVLLAGYAVYLGVLIVVASTRGAP